MERMVLWSAAGRISRRLHIGIRVRPSTLSTTGSDPFLGYHIFSSNSSVALGSARYLCFAKYVAGSVFCSNQRALCDPLLSNVFRFYNGFSRWTFSRQISCPSVQVGTGNEVVRFGFGTGSGNSQEDLSVEVGMIGSRKKKTVSRKAKLKELRFYRLKAKKKLKSPNPEVRIRYKLEKAKRKEAWLIETLRKFELPKAPPDTHDPEILTEEDRFYLKRTGEKKKHYVPVGRRGVFGGVVLNMHLHWKRHETVKVVCKPCKPGQIHGIAEELAQLSKGIIIDIKPNNIVIFYRGKNYVRPEVLSPTETLSKNKALEKYKYQQSLEHTSRFIERLEKELEDYREHLALYRKRGEKSSNTSAENT